MFFVLLIVQLLVLIIVIKSVTVLEDNQRGVIVRLGKIQQVVGPGIVVIIPFIDRLMKIDLNVKIPGWQGLSKEALEVKIKAIMFN